MLVKIFIKKGRYYYQPLSKILKFSYCKNFFLNFIQASDPEVLQELLPEEPVDRDPFQDA